MQGIIQIDMHIRDERVLGWLKERISESGGTAKVTHDAIAEEFRCHRLTAGKIVRRLRSAGHIAVIGEYKRGGLIYAEPQ